MSKYFKFWDKIFKDKIINLDKDLYYITADEIKHYTNQEPRLMAKIDSSKDLPPIFKNNGYCLLPVKNGVYAIVRGDGFHFLEKNNDFLIHYSKINLLMSQNLTSESRAIDYAINTGAVEKVLNIENLYPSFRGRCRSKKFSFFINDILLKISSVQMEIDMGLEGIDAIVIIEGKMKTPKDFIIRQLYYPYRDFNIRYPTKKVIPVFFTYDKLNHNFNFWVYEFKNNRNYNSISLINSKSLKIYIKDEMHIEDLSRTTIKRVAETKDLIIPQANDLDKVIELVFKVKEGLNNYKSIANYFGFRERQSSYYREAAEAIGLVGSGNGIYYLTNVGKRLTRLPIEERNIYFSKLLLNFTPIQKSLNLLKIKGILSYKDTEDLIRYCYNISGQTIARRANSLRAWLKWISKKIGVIYFDKNEKVFKLSK